ncbi:MAG TPA: ScyD/ScyE family protein [Gaiellales bacterium]|nr:ScyD/ScyE family protein [Gaiellales bacterium]
MAVAAIAAIAAVPSAQAHSPKTAPSAPAWKTVASGLDNPRGLAVAKNGDIWVAEAGRGGAGPCQPGNEAGSPASCFGASGAYTLVHNGVQKRVVTGLPSFGDEGTGDAAIGASDIVVNGSHVTGLVGGGGGRDERAALVAAAGPAAGLFDTMLKIDPWKGTVKVFADFAAYETDNNPDKGDIDSDSYGLAEVHGGFVVADAAGNDVLGVNFKKQISTLAVFPDVQVDAPPFLGLPAGTKIPMQAVPTTVAVRPRDPNVYVGQLTGFPFPPGAANVWGVRPDGSTFLYATGFTNIVDIAWGPKGSLYVVEIASNGLLSGDPAGALIRVWPNGNKTTVASTGLNNPTGVAIAHDGTVYVTNYGTSAGKGTVLNLGKV